VQEHSEREPTVAAPGAGSSAGAGSPRTSGSFPSAVELLEYLARGLVERPDEVSVERFEEDDGTVVLELAVAEEEYGRVIGRGGRTAQALRTIVRAGAADGRRLVVDIVD
jgi:predicted RNA-binding protein YlqC (UPF0109 family)